MPCCPEFERHHRLVTALLTPLGDGLDRPALLARVQDALAALRAAGCSELDQRRLLMPAALRLLLDPALDDMTRANLQTWIDVAAVEPGMASLARR